MRFSSPVLFGSALPNKLPSVTGSAKKQTHGFTYSVKPDHFTSTQGSKPHFTGAYELTNSDEFGRAHNKSSYDKKDIVTVDGKPWGLTAINKFNHRREVEDLENPSFLMDARKAKEALNAPNFGRQFLYVLGQPVTLDDARRALAKKAADEKVAEKEAKKSKYTMDATHEELKPLLDGEGSN